MGEVEAVINLAGMLGTPELFGSEYQAAEVNILGAINVYDVAARLGIPVVQIGTGHKGQPNPYAITKGCAEDIGLARARWCGERIAVVRAFHVYGPGQAVGPPHGLAHVHKFFPTFACRALTGMPLELCGGGGQLIDPVYVDDVARVLVDAVSGPYGEVLEAGNGTGVPVKRVAFDIGMLTSGDAELRTVEDRQGEPRDADVVAVKPLCDHPWPYLVDETAGWYRSWLDKKWDQGG
jgi:UDP-glucose 4-epimerase